MSARNVTAQNVPPNWDVRRLKSICSLAYGDSLPDAERSNGEIPVYGSNGKIGTHVVSNTDGPSIVIGRKGSFGKVHFSEQPAFAIDTTYFVDRNYTQADLHWLFYLLASLGLDTVSRDSAIPGLNRDDAYRMACPYPPPEEQAAIVRYLDHADELISRYIGTKERLIALLEEQRQSVIHQAVTRGLDLDAPTKASGAPWIGSVPQHWDVAPVKRHYTIRLGKMLQPERHTPDDIQVPFLKAINVHWFDVSIENPSTTWASKRDIQEYAITKGDLLVCEGGEGGRSAIIESVPDGYIIQKALHRVRPKPGASNKFLLYVLSVAAHWGWFDVINNKATIAHFTVPQLSSLMIPTPPTDEQARIANHLDIQTGSIRKAIEQAQHQITLMSEYRSRLIADVVTGQTDVRNATIEVPGQHL